MDTPPDPRSIVTFDLSSLATADPEVVARELVRKIVDAEGWALSFGSPTRSRIFFDTIQDEAERFADGARWALEYG